MTKAQKIIVAALGAVLFSLGLAGGYECGDKSRQAEIDQLTAQHQLDLTLINEAEQQAVFNDAVIQQAQSALQTLDSLDQLQTTVYEDSLLVLRSISITEAEQSIAKYYRDHAVDTSGKNRP